MRSHVAWMLAACSAIVSAAAGSSWVSGSVLAARDDDQIAEAAVRASGQDVGCYADSRGRFTLKLPGAGAVLICVSRVGYAPDSIRVRAVEGETTGVVFHLSRWPISMDAVDVRAAPEAAVSERRVTSEQITHRPDRYDFQRVVAREPGVATQYDFGSPIAVHGGSPDENLTFVDGFEIPYPVHFGWFGGEGGGVSVISEGAVRDIEFVPGGFPASDGDKLSSATHLSLWPGEPNRHLAHAAVSLSGAELTARGGLKERFSYLAAGRYSSLQLIDRVVTLGSAVPSYFDGLLGLGFRSRRVAVRALMIGAADRMKVKAVSYPGRSGSNAARGLLNWRTTQGLAGIACTLNITPGVALGGRVHGSEQGWQLDEEGRGYLKASEIQSIGEVGGNCRLGKALGFQTGAFVKLNRDWYEWARAPDTTPTGFVIPGDTVANRIGPRFIGGYAEAETRLGSWSWFRAGARFVDFDTVLGQVIDPRLAFGFKPAGDVAVGVSLGRFHQPPKMVELQEYRLELEQAWHGIVEVKVSYPQWQWDMAGYYKSYDHLVCPESESSRALNNDERGSAYGGEVALRWSPAAKFGVSSNYSLSFSRRQAWDTTFWSDWDQRHIANLSVQWRPTSRLELTLDWRFSSGRPYTPVIGRYQHPVIGKWLPVMGEHNSARYPVYSRIDPKTWYTFTLVGRSVTAFAGVWNLTNTRNVLAYEWDADYRDRQAVYQFPLTPDIGLKFEF